MHLADWQTGLFYLRGWNDYRGKVIVVELVSDPFPHDWLLRTFPKLTPFLKRDQFGLVVDLDPPWEIEVKGGDFTTRVALFGLHKAISSPAGLPQGVAIYTPAQGGSLQAGPYVLGEKAYLLAEHNITVWPKYDAANSKTDKRPQYYIIMAELERPTIHMVTVQDSKTNESGRDLILVEIDPPIMLGNFQSSLTKKYKDLLECLFPVTGSSEISRAVLTPRVQGMRLLPQLNMDQGSVYLLLPTQWSQWDQEPHMSFDIAEIVRYRDEQPDGPSR
jgi:hypothetical protein